ncbi:hypothetical protein D7B24_002718 [Verticillium nonalfalfae]|uniref:Uncharacterized protein n=1 Tax=Verticillium nonalfalfae TaxID=1051616 RepID=A0A3M9YJZ5_9PEZI|nr:uncharacterized protein D7B24_002718 [Verticillium nonalfalfae]RNJ59340.1 hypothetical protein D7B24_002718 [Verticillium nonalfalfae]
MLRCTIPRALASIPCRSCIVLPQQWTRSIDTFRPTSPVSSDAPTTRRDESLGYVQDQRHLRRENCHICLAEQSREQLAAMPIVRKGRGLYVMGTTCDACWAVLYEKAQQTQAETFARNQARKARSDAMLDAVRAIDAFEAVPIRYASEKLARSSVGRRGNSLEWHRRHLVSSASRLGALLQIAKVRNRYQCNKLRVDAMDFEAWYPYAPERGVKYTSI